MGGVESFVALERFFSCGSTESDIDDHCARCPSTVSIIENLPLMDLAGFSPT